MEKISIGLDIGTNSVGWAVVNEENKIVKKNGFSLWGVRMFDEANTAEERRTFRNNRRRLARRKQRIKLLREIFENEIKKVDEYFFERLDDSFFKIEDKKNNNYYNLFNDEYTDKEYFEKYPTIYHLRKHLLETDEKEDIRMLYLAMHHMIKYRGNFLYPGEEFKSNDTTIIKNHFYTINNVILDLANENEDEDNYFEQININDETLEKLEEIINGKISKIEKKALLLKLFNVDKKSLVYECIIPLLIGSVVNLKNLSFYKNVFTEDAKLSTGDESFLVDLEQKRSSFKEIDSLFDVMPLLKEIVDYYYLLKILGSDKSISSAMVRVYEEHHNDLAKLKELVKKNLPNKYNECFRLVAEKKPNYPSYVGINSTNSKIKRFKHCKREDFYKYINNEILDKISTDNEEDKSIIELFKEKINNTTFLLRQNSDQNGSFPMQLNLMEMKTILNKQAKYYPFLLEKDDEYTNIDKIEAIFTFKVPYYVGPLNIKSDYSWVVRTNEKVYPWNFDKVVDKDESAKRFIERMQNKCTYLKGDDDFCLPKNSLLFSEYNCLCYLNRLTINGALITKKVKDELFENVFLKIKKPNKKDLYNYLISNGYIPKVHSETFPDVNCDMSSYVTFKNLFKDDFDEKKNMIEKIIKDIVIFEDRNILERRLRELYKLNELQIKEIKGYNYKGYSRLSKRFLSELVGCNEETGECSKTIIEILRETNMELQQILHNPEYNFIKAIDDYNKEVMQKDDEENFEDFIQNHIYVSPIMKRSLIQSYKIIEEVEKILNRKIDKYYVECSRVEEKKEQKNSRYVSIKNLYANCKILCKELSIDYDKLSKRLEENKDKLKSDKLYLYFTQLGKCLYTFKDIDINNLLSANSDYDIDHIYPQSLISDDSLSNRVLALKRKNALKSDKMICDIPGFLSSDCLKFIEKLKNLKLISNEKYRRLTKKEFLPEELEGFVNRQIVATNQAVIGLIDTLKLYKHVDSTNIVYSKAHNISEFRNKYDLVKSRTANNYHHAHDAYLNVVIGRAINDYYIANHFARFNDYQRLKSENKTINPDIILNCDRKVGNKIIWEKDKTIKLINETLYSRFDISETIRTFKPNSMFSKVTILPAGEEDTVPVKTTDFRKDTFKYGGITSNSYSRYVIVRVKNNKKIKYILEAIPKTSDPSNASFEQTKQKINEYLLTQKEYKDNTFEVVNYDIRTNVVVKDGKKKFVLTGKSNDRFLQKNIYDRNFSKKDMKIIKYLDKYFDNLKKQVIMTQNDDYVIVSEASKKTNKEIKLTKSDLIDLFINIKNMYSKDIYSYSVVQIIKNITDFKEYSVSKLAKLCNETLQLFKTNERTTANLKEFGGSEFSGVLSFSKTLKPSVKFISESITGYYKKILFEVPTNGI